MVFFAASIVWALAGAAVLETGFVNPVVLSIVWLVGYVWLAGVIAGGVRVADRLVKVWLGMLAACFAIGGASFLVIS